MRDQSKSPAHPCYLWANGTRGANMGSTLPRDTQKLVYRSGPSKKTLTIWPKPSGCLVPPAYHPLYSSHIGLLEHPNKAHLWD